MDLQFIKNQFFKWGRKILLYGVGIQILLFLIAFILFQIPAIQQALVGKYTKQLTYITGFTVSFERFYLRWYDRIEIDGLKVLDPEANAMVTAQHISVNFSLIEVLKNNRIHIDGITLQQADVYLSTIDESISTKNLNINVFINRLSKPSSTTSGSSPKINIGKVEINHSKFSLNDLTVDSVASGFDPSHFTIDIQTNLQNFNIIGDTIEFKLRSLEARDHKTNLHIQEMRTFFRISQKSMEFTELSLTTDHSFVSDTVILNYQSQDDLSYFNSRVQINAKLKNTFIHPAELALFTNTKEPFPHLLYLDGNISGKVSKFNYRDMVVKMGETTIKGSLQLDGLPNFSESFIDLTIQEGHVNINNLEFLFPKMVFHLLQPLENFSVKATFIGYINDFVANGDFNGKLGRVQTDINLKIIPDKIEESTYTGNLAFTNLSLGKYFKDTVNFQTVTLNGHIKGNGLTKNSANFILNGKISSIGIRGYNYTNITTNARFSSQLFNGELALNDPQAKVHLTGSVDFRKGKNAVNIKTKIDTINFQAIGLSKELITAQTQADIHTKGLHLDSLSGNVLFTQSQIRYTDKILTLDSLHVNTISEIGVKNFNLKSSLIDVNLIGNYSYASLFKDLSLFFKELVLNIKNNTNDIHNYYRTKEKNTFAYYTDFKIKLQDIEPIMKLLNVPVSITKKTSINGRFENGKNYVLKLHTLVDTAIINRKLITQTEINFSASKIRNEADVYGTLTVHSAEQKIAENFSTQKLLTEWIWNKQQINFNLDVIQKGTTNQMNLRSEIRFLTDSTLIKILPSSIYALNKPWQFNPKNYILINGKEWNIHHLEILNENESIILDGQISEQPNVPISLLIKNFNLNLLNIFTNTRFSGIINGEIKARDLYLHPSIQNNISISALTINDFLIGDIEGSNEWNSAQKQFDINFIINRFGIHTVVLKGYYNTQKENPLLLHADLTHANLKIVEPFLTDIFSSFEGSLSGTYTITGNLSKPQINGSGIINDGRLIIDYTKAMYNFNGTLGFTSDKIIFDNIVLFDEMKNKGTLSGYLDHEYFSHLSVHLNAEYREFQLLDTGPKDNKFFYGEAFATGALTITGPVDKIKISATAVTKKNTRIFIPIQNSGAIDKKEFISFVKPPSLNQVKNVNLTRRLKTEINGVTIDFNIDITPEAYTELIFDIKSGDIIRGYGNGQIRLQIDTKNEFNIFGAYEFEKGSYNFTLFDIINKEFSINKGSRISWYGDPYTGQLNLTASYKQLTSLGPILADKKLSSTPQMRRKYPVDVLLKLEGPMLTPQINFDIMAEDLPNTVPIDGGNPPIQLKTEFNAFKAKLDEQELKKQVFSLIVLRRLSSTNDFEASSAISNSVSEFLSNQLSYWLSQVDPNLEIDFDLGNFDKAAYNTFQLRLSYSFLQGRLRITHDGTFNNQYRQNDVANLLGDWTIDYLLTPDGKLKIKMFNRTNPNQITNSIGTQSTISAGVSLIHTQNATTWKSLILPSRRKKKKPQDDLVDEKKESKEIDPTID